MPKPELIDFYATWCEPCKWLEPIWEQVKIALASELDFKKIDVDKHKAYAVQYEVKSVPTLLLHINGKELWRMKGFKYADELIADLKAVLQSLK